MRSHVPRLSVQLVLPVGQAEHPQLAVGELLPCCEYVGNKEGEASVVVEPSDVDGSASLLGALLELGYIPHDLLCKWPSLRVLIDGSCNGSRSCSLPLKFWNVSQFIFGLLAALFFLSNGTASPSNPGLSLISILLWRISLGLLW